jgi:hypothetical protein
MSESCPELTPNAAGSATLNELHPPPTAACRERDGSTVPVAVLVGQIVSRGDPHADSGAAGPSLTTFVLLVLPGKTSNRVGERKAGHRWRGANRSSMAGGAYR